jgi:Zn-dependent peptidase ImmA (M78 family)
MTRGEEDQLTAWARLVGDTIHVAEYDVKLPSVRLPQLPDATSPEEAARLTRQALGIAADAPIPHLMRTVERSGVYVAALDFATELHAKNHDAFSTWVGPTMDVPLMVVRGNSSWERTRLSAAHELGHLVMHRIRRSGDLEADAYAFAAELLLPAHMLRHDWPRPTTLATLMPLKRAWGMSLSSLIEHGYRNNLLSAAQRTSFYKQLSNRKNHATGERWRVQEPGWQDREPERPKLIAVVLETAFGEHSGTTEIASEVFSWRADLIHELIAGQVTSWAKSVAPPRQPAEEADAPLAAVVPLRVPSR